VSRAREPGRTPPQPGSAGSKRTHRWIRLWLVLAVLWASAMAYQCLRGWPTLPLDLPRHDPQVQAAYSRAVTAHVGRYIVLGLAPPLLVLGLGWLASRLGRRRV
jgi:hypothetical protein